MECYKFLSTRLGSRVAYVMPSTEVIEHFPFISCV